MHLGKFVLNDLGLFAAFGRGNGILCKIDELHTLTECGYFGSCWECPGRVAGWGCRLSPGDTRGREPLARQDKGERAVGMDTGTRQELGLPCTVAVRGSKPRVPVLGNAPRRHRVWLFVCYPSPSCATCRVRLPEPRERGHWKVSFTPAMSMATVAL